MLNLFGCSFANESNSSCGRGEQADRKRVRLDDLEEPCCLFKPWRLRLSSREETSHQDQKPVRRYRGNLVRSARLAFFQRTRGQDAFKPKKPVATRAVNGQLDCGRLTVDKRPCTAFPLLSTASQHEKKRILSRLIESELKEQRRGTPRST